MKRSRTVKKPFAEGSRAPEFHDAFREREVIGEGGGWRPPAPGERTRRPRARPNAPGGLLVSLLGGRAKRVALYDEIIPKNVLLSTEVGQEIYWRTVGAPAAIEVMERLKLSPIESKKAKPFNKLLKLKAEADKARLAVVEGKRVTFADLSSVYIFAVNGIDAIIRLDRRERAKIRKGIAIERTYTEDFIRECEDKRETYKKTVVEFAQKATDVIPEKGPHRQAIRGKPMELGDRGWVAALKLFPHGKTVTAVMDMLINEFHAYRKDPARQRP